MNAPPHRPECRCRAPHEPPRLVAVTGGPGAGKTAVLELARRHFCEHVVVLPEAATIVFGGGFPREPGDTPRRAAQHAIYVVQSQLQRIAAARPRTALILCDRGTLDGLAYWPGPESTFFDELATTREAELARYAAVLHLRTPPAHDGYDHSNPVRVESAREAHALDGRIEAAWNGHPHRTTIDAHHDFLAKATAALEAIRTLVPSCCWK